MAIKPINGRDIGLAVQKDVAGTPTYIVVGCMTDTTFDVDTEAEEASCIASGVFKEFISGQSGFTLGGTLNVRQATDAPAGTGTPAQTDATDNITAENLLDLQLAGTPVKVRYQIGVGTGSARYSGLALITKSSFKGQLKGVATHSVSLQGTGPLTKSLAT